jgi:hypothetical protein
MLFFAVFSNVKISPQLLNTAHHRLTNLMAVILSTMIAGLPFNKYFQFGNA